MQLKQFVPSEVCLKCDGCCRFKEERSPWRPKVAKEEIQTAKKGLAEEIFSKAIMLDHHIKTVSCQGHHLCSFFEAKTNTCRIYPTRPFECQLYPFVMTRSNVETILTVHHHCPFIQQKRHSQDFQEYVDYLKRFFADPEVAGFLDRNPALMGEYPEHEEELEYLFTIGPRKAPARPLSLDLAGGPTAKLRLLGQKDRLEGFLKESHQPLSAFSFASFFIWSDFFDFEFETMDGHLCVFADNGTGTFLYLPPLGKEVCSPKTIDKCFERMNLNPNSRAAARIENVPLACREQFSPEGFSFHPKAHEYLYFRKDLIALRGNAFKSKRWSYNFFVKNYAYKFLPYQEEMLEECLRLYEHWAKNRTSKYSDNIYRQMIQENRSVHRLALQYFKELGLTGRVVQVDGKIHGYSFGLPLNEEVFCILFEITELTTKGLAAYLFRTFCDDPSVARYKFINVMDDFGMKNMQGAKLSFRPSVLVPSWVVVSKAQQGI